VDGTQVPTQFVRHTDARDEDDVSPRGTLIRRFSLIFSPSSPPAATDFIVAVAGVQAFDSSPIPSTRPPQYVVPAPAPTSLPTFVPGSTQLVHSGTYAAPVQSSTPVLQRAPSIDELSAFDEEEWIAIAEKSEIWDAPEPEVEELPSVDSLNVDESSGDAEELIPSSQGEEVELTSFNYPSNVVLPHDMIPSPV